MSHLGENRLTHSQLGRPRKSATDSTRRVTIEQRKDKLSEKCDKIIMSLYDCGQQGIL